MENHYRKVEKYVPQPEDEINRCVVCSKWFNVKELSFFNHYPELVCNDCS